MITIRTGSLPFFLLISNPHIEDADKMMSICEYPASY